MEQPPPFPKKKKNQYIVLIKFLRILQTESFLYY